MRPVALPSSSPTPISSSRSVTAKVLVGGISAFVALIMCFAVPSTASAKAHPGLVDPKSVDVIGDDEGDRFVGSGGLVLPGTVGHETRQRVATCVGCRWRLADPCASSADDGAHAACLSVTRGCARAAQLLRVWLSEDGGATWRDLGLVCIPPGGPVTIAQVGSSVAEEFERAIPETGLTYQPRRGVLPYLPVIFHSTQPSALPPSNHVINGVRVVLYPRPSWTWDFGDGASLRTSVPGSTYPDLAVSHTYSRGGRMQVRVTTSWNATYMIDDLGPFQVSLPVTQTATATLPVGQARAVLVP